MSDYRYSYKVALMELRSRHRAEFDLLPRGNTYTKRLGVLRDRHYEEFLAIFEDVRLSNPPRLDDPFPSRVPPGKALCAVGCGKPLLQHRIGECR